MEDVSGKILPTIVVLLTGVMIYSTECQGVLLPQKENDLMWNTLEATAAVLRDSWFPGCSLIYIADDRLNSALFYKFAKDLRQELNYGVFNTMNSRNGTHKERTLSMIQQIVKSSRCTTIVLWSNEEKILREFMEDAIEEELLVWPTRLLLATHLTEQMIQPMKKSLSFINAILIMMKVQGMRGDVHMYIPYSHRSVLVASWTSTLGLVYARNQSLFPAKFRRLTDGANMTVVAGNFPLHVLVTKGIKENGEEDFSFKGPLVNVVKMISDKFNFTYNLIQPPDGSWGYLFPNGTWIGMIGMAIRKEVDFALGPFGITYIRSKVIDYTNPLLVDYGRILGRRGSTEIDPWGFLMPLAPLVWAVTLGMLAFVLFVAFMTTRIDWKLTEVSPKIPLTSYVRSFLQQDIVVPSDSGWEKILLGVWMLSVFILVECYSTNLTSLLAVRYISEPYQSVRIVLDDPNVKIVLTANTAYTQHIAGVDSGIFYEVKQTEKEGKIRYIETPEYVAAVDSLVSRGDHVLLNPLIIMKMFLTENYMENGNCKFYTSREIFLPLTFCMVVPKNSPLLGPINEGIRAVVEGGLYDYWLDNAIPNAKSCKDPPTKITVKAPLSFTNLWGLFAVLVTGYVVSFFIFLSEIIIAKAQGRYKT